MISSRVEKKNGRVNLIVDGKAVPPCAYITYFDERTGCHEFAEEGYEIFSLCASFSGLPLNSTTGFSPLFGIFDVKGKPDFSEFDQNVRQILQSCPEAKIFPRVRISMPLWWVEENENEVCQTPDGTPREALFSEKFRETGAQMLRDFIGHVQNSDYGDHIIGYQIAGGGTEEWFHYDGKGSLCAESERLFNAYRREKGLCRQNEWVSIPSEDAFRGEGLIEDPVARQYLEFVNVSAAETVAHFARVVKECVENRQVVGAFFGYVQAVPDPLRGSIVLRPLLECPDIDFFCSPVSYVKRRALGLDWGEHCAGESIKQHGKLYFLENDIRTCLSDLPENCRPGVDPERKYSSSLWLGPETVEGSVWAMRKSYARQLTHANALWWFDMWGGWYAHPKLLAEAKTCLDLMGEMTASKERADRSHLAVLFDETYSFRVGADDPSFGCQIALHDVLGNTGVTFDAFLLEDYEESVHYQAVLLPFPAEFDTEKVTEVKAFLKEKKIPYLQLSLSEEENTSENLRRRLAEAGVHCYCTSGDVVYHGNGFLCIHAATAGKKKITLPGAFRVTPLISDQEPFEGAVIEVEMQQYETRLFYVREI